MAGHIFLLSCLLAICLPIIFVQLPRFETVKELHAENEAEPRSPVPRRRPLPPSRKILRRLTRPWSETDTDITSAKSEQEQDGPEQIAQTTAGRRSHPGIPRPISQGDACADSGVSTKEEKELRKARAGKKPWDPPFRRQLPRTELVRKSPEGRWPVVADASPPRKTGRDLEARGVATRLFPPDPVPEIDDVNEYDRCSVAPTGPIQTPHELMHRRPPPKNRPQSRDNKRQPSSQEHQSKPSMAQSIPPQRTDPKSLPSPLDGSPLPSVCHLLRSAPPTRTKESPSCPCRHCRHRHSEPSTSQSPSVPPIALEQGPEHTLKEALTVPSCSCRYDGSGASDPQPQNVSCKTLNDGLKFVSQDAKCASKEAAEDANREGHKETSKASKKAPKSGLSLWQVLLVTMGLIIFIFAFAILVAHCLAWFLVYKTEARLGDLRGGLLRGGEMKLCLCGRG